MSGIGSIPQASYSRSDRIKVMQGGVFVDGNPWPLNFNSDDFDLIFDDVNRRIDIAFSKVLNNNVPLVGKLSGGSQVDLIKINAGSDIYVGQGTNTSITGLALNPGLATAPVYIIRSDGGIMRCGGVNRRVGISETGLTGSKNIHIS